MKKLLAILMALAMLLSLAACGATEEAVATEENTTTAEVAETTETETTQKAEETERHVTVTDMSGDEVSVTGEVESIINLWPAGTSSFFVMGAGELVSALAVNNASTNNSWAKLFYPAAGDIPAMGGTSPSIEELLALDPDLVIVHPMTVSDGFAQQIRDAGIPAVNINFSDYETMTEAYTMLGTLLGGEYQEKLTAWCDMVAQKQDSVQALTANIAQEDRPVVYYISGQADCLTTTMGSNSICADWTAIAGGVYATDLMSDPTATEVTAEELFAIDPDVIIVGGVYQHELVEQLETTDGWKDLSAVVNGRVYTNPYGAFAWDRFGLESYFQMEYALMCIQPEIAAENSIDRDHLVREILDFYVRMNGTELTEEQANNMIDGLEPDGTLAELNSVGGASGGMGGNRG